jgi:cell division septation protein DedD
MPIMITFHAGRVALIAVLATLAAGCSREQQDWRSAEAADTREAYGRFVEQHPESELAVQARARLAQLAEERDWAQAGTVATADAYRTFLAEHPSGKWSEEARIRIEAFALGSAPRLAPQTPAQPGGAPQGPSGVRALQLATATAPPAVHPSAAEPAVLAQLIRADPSQGAPARERNSAAGTGGHSYGVQLGAFGSEASADREWRRLQGRFGAQLGGLAPRIVAASDTSGQLYRLQAPAAGEAQARALCDSLREQSQPCVPVLPR